VSEPVIVIEQRLRSGGLVAVLGLILFLFVFASLLFSATASSGSLGTVGSVAMTIVSIVLIVALLLFVRVVVRVVDSPAGRSLEVVYGPGGFVRQVFGPEKLVAAFARNFSMMEMGGWGYRGSVRLIRRAALVTRRGEALEVQLEGKRRFIVTVDEPNDFVTALALPTS
jgi:hypothetical protein